MGAAYSSLGRTKVLYATSFVLLGAKAKFLRMKPSVLWVVALEEISETRWPQSMIPRYFAENSEYDQEIPQSQTADNPVAPRGWAAQPSQDTRKTN